MVCVLFCTGIVKVVCCWCSQDVDKAEKLKAQMDARGFRHSAEALQHLANLSAEYKHNLDEALSYKQQL